ncbi:MAG TPA: hypothetical protein VE869_05705 [Gemmatimonas sp.]|nr:hypothetical protein [Gemmatimonas sp.]
MNVIVRTMIAGSGALALSACGIMGSVDCIQPMYPVIVVEIRDARTGAPLASEARGTIRSATLVDSLRPAEYSTSDPAVMLSRQAYGPSGTYTVEVQRTGYATWTAAGVRVDRGSCNLDTRRLVASLQPGS